MSHDLQVEILVRHMLDEGADQKIIDELCEELQLHIELFINGLEKEPKGSSLPSVAAKPQA